MWRLVQAVKRHLTSTLWVRPALVSILALMLLMSSIAIGRQTDFRPPITLSHETLKDLLTIFTSSMLTVATFSVSAVVTAVATVSGSTTPRAGSLILDDTTTQNLLASFISAFVYSIICMIAIGIAEFNDLGRLIIFVGFVVMVLWVLLSFFRWVDHITRLGQSEDVIERISESALQSAVPEYVGTFGAKVAEQPPQVSWMPVEPDMTGYVTQINVARLQNIAESFDGEIYLDVRPGDLVDPRTAMAYLISADLVLDRSEIVSRIQKCIVISWMRSHTADFRFSLINLSETADRALSPGVNDPGTAINILGRQLQVIGSWCSAQKSDEMSDVIYDRVYMPAMAADSVVRDAFTAIARDGAAIIEVGIRLQTVLQSLVKLGHPQLTRAVVEISRTALLQAKTALIVESDIQRLEEEAARVRQLSERVAQTIEG